MSAQEVEPVQVLKPSQLVPLDQISTYGYMGLGAGKGDDICLATKWYDDDPLPFVCARRQHPDDPRHLTLKHAGREQTSWIEGDDD